MISVIGDLVVDILVYKEKTNFATDTAGNIAFHPGGQANNVASFAARENVKCQLIGKVGNDPFGDFLIRESKNEGVICNVTKVDHANTGSNVVLINKSDGERSMIPDRGANFYLSAKDIIGIENSKLVYLSGYSLFTESTKKAAEKAMSIAFENSIPIALDPSSTYFLETQKEEFFRYLEGMTFFFPNYEEGVLLTGEKEPKKIISKLREYVKVPILTIGNKGCIFFHENSFREIIPPRVNVKDTTAAGDSFTGSFLATYRKTKDIIAAANRAVYVSSRTVTYIGSLPN